MCLLDSEFIDHCPPLLLLHYQLDCFKEDSEPFDHLYSSNLFDEFEDHYFVF
jgi:hypothetical protein